MTLQNEMSWPTVANTLASGTLNEAQWNEHPCLLLKPIWGKSPDRMMSKHKELNVNCTSLEIEGREICHSANRNGTPGVLVQLGYPS